MPTLEERLDSLERTCRRWKLLTMLLVGLMASSFAMRIPLLAQGQPEIPRIFKADQITCRHLVIQNKLGIDDEVNGFFGATDAGAKLFLNSGTRNIGLSVGNQSDAEFRINQGGRERFKVTHDQLSFDRDEPGAAQDEHRTQQGHLATIVCKTAGDNPMA